MTEAAMALTKSIAQLSLLFMPLYVLRFTHLVCRMVGFQANAWKFFYFALMFFTGLACYTYLGQFLVCITPSTLMSMLLSTFISQIWTIVNGFLIPYDQIPVYWQWLNRISPATW